MLAIVASPLAALSTFFSEKQRVLKEFWLKMPLFDAYLIDFERGYLHFKTFLALKS